MRIAKAAKEGNYRSMRSLQWLLAHSRLAKLLAIRRVTSNKGKNTPGVDGVVWRTSRQKMRAVKQLNRRGYRALPLRRVYIRKKSGKLRPLGIPTMRDRAMQALYALTLAPIAETRADPNSYGFREGRSCADALAQCFGCLGYKGSARWILEADIESCLDAISHQWIMGTIPIDRKVLSAWLKAGYLDRGTLYPTLRGTPQGGVISPLIMNMTLDGLEETAIRALPPYGQVRHLVHTIRYADDFIVTARHEAMLSDKILPALRAFLAKRGLKLSEEKTRIVRIEQGFDFLGQHIRRFPSGKVLIQPTRKALQGVQARVRQILKAHSGTDTYSMIRRLNQSIRGWCNYHRMFCATRVFNRFDKWLFYRLKHWLHQRHPNKGRHWIMKTYYRVHDGTAWSFCARRTARNGRKEHIDLHRASRTGIVRHVKVRAKANPYDPACSDYFAKRRLPHNRQRAARGSKAFVGEYGSPKDTGGPKKCLSCMTGNCHVRF
jgi:RNA-directed DNA polymerase